MKKTLALLLLFFMVPPVLGQEGFPQVAGDANGDGKVDQADSAILSEHWGLDGLGWADGDFNGDGWVNAADASIMAANWGYMPPVEPEPPPPSANPEPASLLIWSVLAVLGLGAGCWRRRRK